MDMQAALKNGVHESQTLRFTAILNRKGLRGPAAHVSHVGVLLDGFEPEAEMDISGDSVSLTFPQPVAWNMWYFRTASNSTELDPVAFSFEEYDHGGHRWRTVGSSSHLLFMSTRTFFDGPFSTTMSRSSVEIFDLRTDYGRLVQLINPVVVAAFVGLSSLCGFMGMEWRGRRMLCASVLWCTISNISSSAWYLLLAGRDGRITGIYYAFGAANHGLAFFLLGCLEQERLQMFFGCFGAFFLCWAATLAGRPYDGPYSSAHWALALGVPTAALAGGIQLSRWWIVRAAHRLVSDDRRRYDAMWAEVCAREADGIAELAATADEVRRAAVGDLRQYRPVVGGCSGDCTEASVVGGELETCLVQLRAAAARANPVLRAKVAQWSRATGGLHLQDRRGSSGAYFAPLPPEGSPQMAWVRWAEPKRAARAAEKAVRVYGGDVSRLTDLARQCVVYETAAGLAAGLRGVARDREVAVVRVKSRLRGDYDSGATAGYRDVIVNLRLRCAAALAAGVAGHVCEVSRLRGSTARASLPAG